MRVALVCVLAVAVVGCKRPSSANEPVRAAPIAVAPPAPLGGYASPPPAAASLPSEPPFCEKSECGPAPMYPTRACPDGVHTGGRGPCIRYANGSCGWSRLVCPATSPGASCPPSACSEPAHWRWLCPDRKTESALRCVRADDGSCGMTLARCPVAAQQKPPPPPPPTPPAPPARSCDPLPSDAELATWPVGSMCAPGGGPDPGMVRHIKTLSDGTHIVDNNGRCVRITYRKCYTKCLPPGARIATPSGEVAVRSLHVGDAVWTQSADGKRVQGFVAAVSSPEVRGPHHVARVVLADGRRFTASLQHPLLAGRRVQDLRAGERYAGSQVIEVRVAPYTESHTFDILPSGQTGVYWVDGVPVKSTLGTR